ncbi:hypothetical protein [Hymenobacter chitinivorans]|uniref:Lipopolysaccharide assembly protein A domain-containing protein n=1 Tax=Hymenobacter chitinivorans DSM 11115 TaxID=1121954 RepID=A0A2M9AT17_9BACT|nr:hypothetical protein [Hymenobacter chitinivorans]PJJ48817.1 hypothetical protein CLV45_4529 [Hymenobacter chitinivorans DSM 11115]
MLALKRIVTVLVMVYLLLALLFIFSPATRDTFASTFNLTGPEGLASFYYTLFIIGAILLALHLITENMDSALLRRETTVLNGKINELKAKLYDHQIDQREREFQQRTVTSTTTTTAAPVTPVVPVTPAPAPTTVYQSGPVTPAPVYIDSAIPPTHSGTVTPGHDVEHPTFPQQDPGLMNAPVQQPNTIITPNPGPTPDNRTTL